MRTSEIVYIWSIFHKHSLAEGFYAENVKYVFYKKTHDSEKGKERESVCAYDS